jgi:aminoglycoside/choline kinase family phosphotransferase
VRWWEQARAAGVPLGDDFAADFGEFWRALEWMGLQRHLKVMGIFCRLKHRDGKPRYAEDLPRFFAVRHPGGAALRAAQALAEPAGAAVGPTRGQRLHLLIPQRRH